LVGLDSPDDGGVIDIGNGIRVVQTVDFFTPILDNPFDWGKVAAANALSDIYAMGGTPISSLQLVSWPREDLSFEILSEVLKGGLEIMQSAGCNIIGGHSIDDKEPKYGFAVTGIINDAIYKKRNLQVGDKLFLTKPLGSGIISSAIKKNIASEKAISEVTEVMTTLNDKALEAAKELNANAITDVTGFGLLGHLIEMIGDSEVTVNIYLDNVPVIEHAKEYLNNGVYPSGSKRNFDSAKENIIYSDDQESFVKILSDAQTSGGLLISAPNDNSIDLDDISDRLGLNIWEIGDIVSRYKNKVNIINSK
jgi:selenide,water dikinase|tara:strand:- start:438 stop:1361 length:924 start_codon:yes stop_codon:yes gene_type:complete